MVEDKNKKEDKSEKIVESKEKISDKKEVKEKEEVKKDKKEDKPKEEKEGKEKKDKEEKEKKDKEQEDKEAIKKRSREERIAVLNIYTTFNNTIMNLTDLSGKSFAKFSGGQSTKQDRLKANPTIAMFVAQKIAEEARDNGITGFMLK